MVDFEQLADRIKSEVTCLEYGKRCGLNPDRSGFVRCPVHNEKTASCKLYDSQKGWYCFGCHQGGSVINLAMAYFGYDFKMAVKAIAAEYHIVGTEISDSAKADEMLRKRAEKADKREFAECVLQAFTERRIDAQIECGTLYDLVRLARRKPSIEKTEVYAELMQEYEEAKNRYYDLLFDEEDFRREIDNL